MSEKHHRRFPKEALIPLVIFGVIVIAYLWLLHKLVTINSGGGGGGGGGGGKKGGGGHH